MLIATIPLLFAVVGLLVFALTDGKISQVGLFTFGAAMTALMIVLSKHTIHIG